MMTIRRQDLEGDYSLRDVMRFLFKRRRVVIGFFLSTVVAISLWTLLTPPRYEVTAAILLKKSRAEVSLTTGPNPVTEQDLNSEISILTSRQLIEDVLRSLRVDESMRPKSILDGISSALSVILRRPNLTYLEQMVLRVIERDLEVFPVRRSNILTVSYRSNNPGWATEFVKTLTERYLARRNEVYESAPVSFFEQEARLAKERLAQAEASQGAFLKSAGITMVKAQDGTDALAAEKELGMQRLSQIETRLAETESALEESRKTVAELDARLAVEPERLPSANRLNLDPAIEEIQKGLVALELRRDALIQDFKPGSRQVQDIEAQIRLAKEQLREAQARAGNIDRTELNPVQQALKTQLRRAQADREGTRARSEALKHQASSYRRVVEALTEKGLALEKLNREAKSAEEAYLLYRKKYEEARISAAMDLEKIVNVSIAQPAQKPLKPVAPKKMLNLILAIALGLVGGIGLAIVLEYFDHTFTTGSDVERRLGIPHLASITDGS